MMKFKKGTRRYYVGGMMAAAALGAFVIFRNTPFKEVDIWVCPVCGSTRVDTVWFGRFRQEDLSPTSLEHWLKNHEPGFEPNWQPLSTLNRTLMGQTFSCGKSPEVLQLRPILDAVVEKLDDTEISELVLVLRHGSEDDQDKMIRKVSDDVAAKG